MTLLHQRIVQMGLFTVVLGSVSFSAFPTKLDFPQPGVICDLVARYCVDKNGLSLSLTQFYLGHDAQQHLRDVLGNEEAVNLHEFTFSNGVHCDTTEQQCYQDRYYPRTPEKREISITDYLFGQSVTLVNP